MIYSLFYRSGLSKRGSGLVEVLVAVLVIAVGVTATLQMYVTSSRNSKNSYYRLQAQFYIDDLFNRMRGNTLGANFGHYVVAEGPCAQAPLPLGNAEGEKVARQDLNGWARSITSKFGNVHCAVDQPDPSRPRVYRVTLGWTEDGTAPNVAECNQQDRSTLCFSVTSLICANIEGGVPSVNTCS